VHDVVVAIDGDKPLFDCLEIRDRCAVFDDAPPAWATRGVCSIHAVMQSAEKVMRHELKQHTLSDIANRTIDKAPASYGTQVVQWLTARAVNRRGDKAEESLRPARKTTRPRNRG
jgi:DNA-binding IscR family transcriptional regulator